MAATTAVQAQWIVKNPIDAATEDSSLILPSQIIPIQVERIRNMLHGLSRRDVIL